MERSNNPYAGWQRVNIIVVFSKDGSKLLFCKRKKDPYQGLYNLVGGKLEKHETGILAAYRELKEETGITRLDIHLHHMMDFAYYGDHTLLEVYVGRLLRKIDVEGDENELCWLEPDEDFFDMTRFAGEGNIGHILEIVKQNRKSLLGLAIE